LDRINKNISCLLKHRKEKTLFVAVSADFPDSSGGIVPQITVKTILVMDFLFVKEVGRNIITRPTIGKSKSGKVSSCSK